MDNRDFSDSAKLRTITDNLKKNNGNICCAICGSKLLSITECHFDHILPFSKGGNSAADNCQILCISCNLKKSDKELQDFVLEEKAKLFLAGKTDATSIQQYDSVNTQNLANDKLDTMSKELFDQRISDFIAQKGDIHKVDFSRVYNHLPPFRYVAKYYGDINGLKKAFGVEDLSASWNRETIKAALEQYVEKNGDLFQKDLKKENRLPSIPCVLNYYPEYNNFTDIKKSMLNLPVRSNWDAIESVIQAGKEYVKNHGNIVESSLRAENHLPTARVIYKYFGSLAAFQQVVGSEISQKNEFISEKDLENAVNQLFGEKERKVASAKEFFAIFPYSHSTIVQRYGSFATFCQKNHITVKKSKKAYYSKQEVDDAISKWVKEGKDIPTAHQLSKQGLPCASVIRKYYEDWKEPFVMYQKMFEKWNK